MNENACDELAVRPEVNLFSDGPARKCLRYQWFNTAVGLAERKRMIERGTPVIENVRSDRSDSAEA